MVPNNTKWQACQTAQNEHHYANGTKGGTGIEWQNSADWPHAGAVVVNCFWNFRNILKVRPNFFIIRTEMFCQQWSYCLEEWCNILYRKEIWEREIWLNSPFFFYNRSPWYDNNRSIWSISYVTDALLSCYYFMPIQLQNRTPKWATSRIK